VNSSWSCTACRAPYCGRGRGSCSSLPWSLTSEAGAKRRLAPSPPILVAYFELLIWYPVGRVGRMLGWGGGGLCVYGKMSTKYTVSTSKVIVNQF
jgi:hypothetical protein